MAGIITRTKSAQSIFPLHFHNSLGPDIKQAARYQLLEQYCNRNIRDKGRQLKLIGTNESNVYRDELTEELVAATFRRYSQAPLEWEGCICLDSSFCDDNTPEGTNPCHCLQLFSEHTIVPVYITHIPEFGLGVFANKDIKKGEYIMDYQGEFSWAMDVCDENYDDESEKFSVDILRMGRPAGIVLDASRIGGLGRFLNHSCDANVEAFTVFLDGKVRVAILAERDIKPFQQLCWNYGSRFFSRRNMVCFCGSRNCGIRPITQWDKEGRAAYLNFLKDHSKHGPEPEAGQSSSSQLELHLKSSLRSETPSLIPLKQQKTGEVPTMLSIEQIKASLSDNDSDEEEEEVTDSNKLVVMCAPSSGPGNDLNKNDSGKGKSERGPTPIRIATTNEGPISATVRDMFHGEDNYADLQFETKDGKFLPGHKCFLSARSPFFRTLIKEELSKEGFDGVIKMPEISALNLAPILEWIYTGSMDCTADNCMEIAVPSIRFGLTDLVSALDKAMASIYDGEDEETSKMKTVKFCRFVVQWRKELPDTFDRVRVDMNDIWK